MKDLSIIIVNYNVKEFVLNLLDSIRKAKDSLDLEIFVVDNNSTDGSVEAIKEKFPDVQLIQNKKNVGFGAANNQALKIATGKYLLMINPDTIVKEDTFVKMINFFEKNEKCGIAGCKVLNVDGTLQLACRRSFPGPWTSFTKVMGLSTLFPKSKLFAKYNLTYLDENKTYEVDAVSGAFMMMRKSVYDMIAGFDEQFFMYGEDLDLCYRTQKAGYKVFYFHETEIIHYKGESTKRSSIDETKLFYDAMHLFVRKHLSTSFIVELILQSAIIFRKIFAFANVYKIPIASAFIDLLLFSFAIILAEIFYLNPRTHGFPYYAVPWVYFIPSLIQVTINFLIGVYKKNSLLILRTIISLVVGLIFLSSLTFFFKQYAFSRAVVLIVFILSLFTFSVYRVFLKVVFKIGLDVETKKSKTLIVGTKKFSEEIANKLKNNINKLFEIVGFIGLDQKHIGEKVGDYKILGSTENLKRLINDYKIDKVIFISEELSFNHMFSVISECQGTNVEFLVSGKEMDYLVGKSSITMLEDIPLLKVQYNVSMLGNRISKRLFDITFGILFLIFLYPFIYLFYKINSRKSDFVNFILKIPGVCSGKFSFVGPFSLSFHDNLYVGKVGLTGLWFTESIDLNDYDEIKKMDIYYAKNQSIWLDIEILGKTFSKIFFKAE
ncbi:MAG: glycosyltransferase [Melioribacteraceae bacterium]|nr:glycosyltransferase [Melioribacteraceae bacterium]